MENAGKVASIKDRREQEIALRDENHAETLAAIKDSADAQAASGMIAKEPREFVQTGSHRGAELLGLSAIRDSSYTGTADPMSGADGVPLLLDETMQKFIRQEADCEIANESDQKAYEQDMADKEVEMHETTTDTHMETSKEDSVEEKMHGMAAVLKNVFSELDAAQQYSKGREPACGTGTSSCEDRKKARVDEKGIMDRRRITEPVSYTHLTLPTICSV